MKRIILWRPDQTRPDQTRPDQTRPDQKNNYVNKKEYLYIVQSSLEQTKCKIGITDNLERRLKEYNSITGKSKDNIYAYIFTCEVKNMHQIENDIKNNFPHLREQKSKEIYFYNSALFDMYADFIKSHNLFVKEIFIKPEEKKTAVKIVKKTTPTLEERGLTRRDVMQKAQNINNDEFYTRYEDVEKEIEMYDIKIWKNKCVFCNCDDAVGESRTEKDSSAFALYFIKNFIRLKLKKLICTHYSGQVDLFNAGAKGYIFTKDGVNEMIETPKNYTGSFDDDLSLKILKEEADIVCTNPPFSRAIDYWNIIINSGKKFLIISNISNAVTKSYIPYFVNKKVWAGYNSVNSYLNPKKEITTASGHWYTNIEIKERPKYKNLKIVPIEDIPDKYKKYDDNGILIVDNCYIPNDYNKPFAISVRPVLNGVLEKGYKMIIDKEYYPYCKGKKKFARVLIQKE
ncbi:adenine-specific methyltransferase EcoRI family protein [Brachyspira hyodysenteriae]|uniref:adenine-specific methyltransferase EcoRI family protein n=1 Tax=Brachyspira hyodysenteriae TaxID=159 RepID=UPI0022CE054D|nr:adenine-specific methyltransferase EcoRI family protein [Brachyspira hyodysenteriae]MDA0032242.1 GIY-YIG nuclease family protein [Brachyspira hyodysenteriae]